MQRQANKKVCCAIQSPFDIHNHCVVQLLTSPCIPSVRLTTALGRRLVFAVVTVVMEVADVVQRETFVIETLKGVARLLRWPHF